MATTQAHSELRTTARPLGRAGIAAILFVCLFAAQASLIALTPVLAQVASDLGVSTAAAGQLRTLSGITAGTVALVLAFTRRARRIDLRELLTAGAVVLAGASVASALAPGFVVLAAAQVGVGVGVGLLVTAGTTAAAEWVLPEHRAQVLSWALIGMPAAWIVGMPVIGSLGEIDWRYVWIALPLTAAVVAAIAVTAGPRSSGRTVPCGSLVGVLAAGPTARWLLGEVLANSAWIGTLVYAGALFAESYSTTPAAIGFLLALAACAFVAGNLWFRRWVAREARTSLVRLALVLAVGVAAFGVVRPSPAASTVLLSVVAFVAGGRTLLGSAFGLTVSPERRMAIMGARAAANQYGYFFGSAIGGLALSTAGYTGLGLLLGALFAMAALTLSTEGVSLRGSVDLVRWSTGFSVRSRWSTGRAPFRSAGVDSGHSSLPCS